MIRQLRNFFRARARTKFIEAKALPPPEVPVVALLPIPSLRPQRQISRADAALAQEDNSVEQDLETCFALMRARQLAHETRRQANQGQFLIVLSQVEKFAYDCLDFGPGQTHHMTVDAAARAFSKWLTANHRDQVHMTPFARALTTVLEWQGGHRAVIDKQDLFIGCKLAANFTESLGRTARRPLSKADRNRLGMGLNELMGGRSSTG